MNSGPSPDVLQAACAELAKRDQLLARAFASTGLPKWRSTTADISSLARIVVGQLISTGAADTIWDRLVSRLPAITARVIHETSSETLLGCGLSRPKVAHLKAISLAELDGRLDFAALPSLAIDAAREKLLSLRGVGPWTAETFLMNALGCLDAFPVGDIGLMESHRRLSGLDQRISASALSALAENWRPHRAVAAHLLYDWLHFDRAERA